MGQRVVITGEGIVSSIGNDKEQVYDSLKNGVTGIRKMKYLNSIHTELPVGEVQLSNDEMKSILGIQQSTVMSRTALMGIIAIKQAISESGISKRTLGNGNSPKILLISGTTVGGMDLAENIWDSALDNSSDIETFKQYDCGGCTEVIANYFDIFSDYTTISTACSSGANAIILGAELIKAGKADIVVAGGTEALSKFHLNGFNSLMILDREKCRPFDDTRAGLNLGEGAGFVVIESEECAKSRNANIHCYLNGYGNACDAFHQTASSDNGEGAFRAMSEAIAMAGLEKSDIVYVNAHGTGTPNNDMSESAALIRVFEDKLPFISSTKMFTGHTTSASGGIEAVICILTLLKQFVPGNIGWKHPIKDGIVPIVEGKEYNVTNVLCNSFGFGGNDSSLIFSTECSSGKEFAYDDNISVKILSKEVISNVSELDEIKRFIKPIEARRMGKLMKSSLLSSLKALEKAHIERPDAIITATWWGCLENSEQLLNQIKESGESLLKPTLFMQSTHNTIGSNIAIRTQCYGYNVTYSQKDKSLDWAMKDAEMLIKSKKARTVLVGLHNETTPRFKEILAKLGLSEQHEIESLALVLSCGDC